MGTELYCFAIRAIRLHKLKSQREDNSLPIPRLRVGLQFPVNNPGCRCSRTWCRHFERIGVPFDVLADGDRVRYNARSEPAVEAKGSSTDIDSQSRVSRSHGGATCRRGFFLNPTLRT